MNFQTKKVSEKEIELIISASAEKFSEYLDQAFKKLVQSVESDGFRKGKMPKEMFIKKYGNERLYPDAIDFLLNDQYHVLLDQEGIEPTSPVKFDYEKMEVDVKTGFKITGLVEIVPEIELKNYKEIVAKIKKPEVKITTEQVDEKINEIVSNQALIIEKEGKIEDGDTVTLDFEGFLDNIPFEGGKAEKYELVIGSKSFIPGFEDQLIGHGKGEEIDINVTFPKDYQADNLKGKEVIFKCKIHEVKTKEKSELTNKLVSNLHGFESKTIEELKKEIKENLIKDETTKQVQKWHRQILQAIAQTVKIELPESLIEQELEVSLKGFAEQLNQQGMNLEKYLEMMKLSELEIKQEMRPDVEKGLIESLILKQLIKVEKIKATEEDLGKKYQEMADIYKMDLETVKSMMEQNKSQLESQIKYDKVFDKITMGV